MVVCLFVNCCCKCQQCPRDNNKCDMQASTTSPSFEYKDNEGIAKDKSRQYNPVLAENQTHNQNRFNGLLTTRNIFRLSPWPTSWPLSKFMPKIPATALISPTAKVPVTNTSPICSKSLSQSACFARCNQYKNCWKAAESEPDLP